MFYLFLFTELKRIEKYTGKVFPMYQCFHLCSLIKTSNALSPSFPLSGRQPECKDSPPVSLRLRQQKTSEAHGQAPGGAGSPQTLWPCGQRAGQGMLRQREVLLGSWSWGKDGVEPGRRQADHKQERQIHRLPLKRVLDVKPEGGRPVRRQHVSGHRRGPGAPPQEGGRLFGLYGRPRVILLRWIWSPHPHVHRYIHRQAASLLQSWSTARWQKCSSANDIIHFL